MDPDVTEAFNGLMAQLDAPMAIVTTEAGGERAGCLIGFQAQCSIDPVRYVVWLSKANHTCRVGLRSKTFAVHLLGKGDRELAELFGGTSGDDHDKFAECAWTEGPGGVPLLDGCPNRFVGRRVAMLDEGSDHVCMVVEPIEASAAGAPFEPLRLSDVRDITPGHEAEERPSPPTQRAR